MQESMPTSDLIEKLSEQLDITPDEVRSMMVSSIVDRTRVGKNPEATRKRRQANKNARKARRRNR
jgi:hypothetical protein